MRYVVLGGPGGYTSVWPLAKWPADHYTRRWTVLAVCKPRRGLVDAARVDRMRRDALRMWTLVP